MGLKFFFSLWVVILYFFTVFLLFSTSRSGPPSGVCWRSFSFFSFPYFLVFSLPPSVFPLSLPSLWFWGAFGGLFRGFWGSFGDVSLFWSFRHHAPLCRLFRSSAASPPLPQLVSSCLSLGFGGRDIYIFTFCLVMCGKMLFHSLVHQCPGWFLVEVRYFPFLLCFWPDWSTYFQWKCFSF